MALRTHLERWVMARWRRRGPVTVVLLPLALLHGAWRRFDAWRYRAGLRQPHRLRVPVVVVGNLYVGGTGKTPLVMEIVKALKARGWHPGIVSRGHGAANSAPLAVDPHGTAAEFGDEPLLLAAAGDAPVAVGHDRAATAEFLMSLHPRIDVVVTDDGLQHRPLARDLEIAVIDSRGLGNGWLLPAGPLRDPPDRLRTVDAVVFNDRPDRPRPAVRVYSPLFAMRGTLDTAYALKDPTRSIALDELAAEQSRGSLRLLAACGIGVPERFFAMLREAGLHCDELALADHYPYTDNPFAGRSYDCLLITEKDAVKCRSHPALAADGRICVVPLRAHVDPDLFELVESRLRAALEERPHGPTPA